jgi:hypothetical protein
MPLSFDDYMPKTSLCLKDGSILTVGTMACEDNIHQDVFLRFTHANEAQPAMNIQLTPKAVDVLISKLQEYANEARFVNGTKMVDYGEPNSLNDCAKSSKKKKPAATKKKTNTAQ